MSKDIVTGLLLDEVHSLTLEELCQACREHSDWIVELVNEGILEPSGQQVTSWHFTAVSLQRARTVRRLQHDLGINLAGAALVLDLMDEIEALHARLRRYDP
jgi:chaperone modulatory protein CbpM